MATFHKHYVLVQSSIHSLPVIQTREDGVYREWDVEYTLDRSQV